LGSDAGRLRHEAEISALLGASRAVLESREFKETARSIFDSCRGLIGAQAGYIALLSEDGSENEVVFLEPGGLRCTVDPSLPMPIRGLRGVAYQSAKAVYDNDFSGSEWVNFMPKGHVRLDNVLFAPLNLAGKTAGLLGLGNKPGGFTENDLRLASAFGEFAAIALRNSRLMGSLRESEKDLRMHRDRLDDMVKERTSALRAVNEDLEVEISERRQAEKLLRESEEKFRGLAENVPIGIAISTPEGRVIEVNPAMLEMFGYRREEILRLPASAIYDNPKDMERFLGLLRKGEVKGMELDLRRSDGTTLRGLVNSTTHKTARGEYIFTALQDITGYKKMEEHLRHAQKMEAIGHLTGGVAHDFNNRLSAIMNYGYLLKMKMPEDDPLRVHVEQILGISEKAASLTQGLLAFGRKQVIDLKPVSLNDIVRAVEKILQRVMGEDIELKALLSEGDLTILADAGLIENVLINLATNARDAMPDGGLLLVETEALAIDEKRFKLYDSMGPGSFALVSVTDTGAGMDKEIREKIFEPFFTTKGPGKGTGLGLSVVYGIVKQHGGAIDVSSEPGKGTTFKIYLPIAASGSLETPMQSLPQRGAETVLLAEDDPDIRRTAKDILEEFGYRVVEAENGEDALGAFHANANEISLLIFDVMLPKKHGMEVYEEIKALRPGIKVLFTSGYTANVIHEKGILKRGVNFISKPASPDEFLRKVRETLDK